LDSKLVFKQFLLVPSKSPAWLKCTQSYHDPRGTLVQMESKGMNARGFYLLLYLIALRTLLLSDLEMDNQT